ncbi:hypothetical protein QBC39DRAFT_356135 [Podospora conica]|nr:hypothetical protein QBC39DRAFT_356135 [Schizothecium conicum]
MSSRSNRQQRQIRGPQSALTDFLASHNISANQIRLDADARRRAAEANGDAAAPAQDAQATTASAAELANEDENEDGAAAAPPARGRRTAARLGEERRQREQDTVDQIKSAKKKTSKRKLKDDDSDDDYELAKALSSAARPPGPGQSDNCAVCGKRFTVTAYSRNAPDGGGLLCTPCGKELAKDDAVPKKKPKRLGNAEGRRQVQSKILDGTYHTGAKSLMTLCIETLAKNIDLADDISGLPSLVVDKIARKLSKHRLLDPNTLNLFIQPTVDEIPIYDGAKLTADEYMRVLQTCPELKKLKIVNGIHFKDEVMDYLLSRNIELEDFHLHGANLLSDAKWQEFLQKKGQFLKSLKVSWTDKHFTNATLAVLKDTCPSLVRLKVTHNQSVSGDGVKALAQMPSLRHISLDLRQTVHSDVYVNLVKNIGENLETLSLTRVPDVDNTLLDAIHNKCRHLKKLRITDSEIMTDEGFFRLFDGWANKGLEFIDFQNCRQLESMHPRENPDGIGLCSKGFNAMMVHSGRFLQFLNVQGCRHITKQGFEEAFGPDKVYPELAKVEISFCEEVTDFIVGSIFRSCPKLRELNVFGCMKVKDVRVPRGRILVGVPNAMGMVIDGDDG